MGRNRQRRKGPGSTYEPSSRTDRCTASCSWARPDVPTSWPRLTSIPAETDTSPRYDIDTLTAPASMVTDRIPATEPANVTVPVTGATTGVPAEATMSTPQCPA